MNHMPLQSSDLKTSPFIIPYMKQSPIISHFAASCLITSIAFPPSNSPILSPVLVAFGGQTNVTFLCSHKPLVLGLDSAEEGDPDLCREFLEE